MRRLLVVLIVLTLALVGGGCGSSKSSSQAPSSSASQPSANTTHFAKTKFALHAGLAFGAFHRYIFKPYTEGKFSGGLRHRKLATAKAAIAAGFAYHEVRLALNDARSSKILSKVLSPLLALQTKLSSLRDGLRHGNANAAEINSANGNTGSINAQSSKVGQPIQDQPTPQLGG
jgi:hypothetical protein